MNLILIVSSICMIVLAALIPINMFTFYLYLLGVFGFLLGALSID